MRFTSMVLSVLFVCGAFLTVTAADVPELTSSTRDTTVTICGKCGEIKGGELCCKQDATICEKCGLHKDAIGCCKIEKGKDAKICCKCGEIVGSEKCCKEGIELCPKCNLHKDSVGCCKLDKIKTSDLKGCCMKGKTTSTGCVKASKEASGCPLMKSDSSKSASKNEQEKHAETQEKSN